MSKSVNKKLIDSQKYASKHPLWNIYFIPELVNTLNMTVEYFEKEININ